MDNGGLYEVSVEEFNLKQIIIRVIRSFHLKLTESFNSVSHKYTNRSKSENSGFKQTDLKFRVHMVRF